MTRRELFRTTAAGAAAATVAAAQQPTPPPAGTPQATPSAAQVAPPERRREAAIPRPPVPPFAENRAALKVQPFALSKVRLNAGPCRDVQEINHKLLLELPNDRMLHNFRINAGLPSTAEPLGGWEQPWSGQPNHRASELRGHFIGHYLSACALMYAATDDKALKDKADSLVAELAKCQEKLGGESGEGYLSAWPAEFLHRLKNGEVRGQAWAPFYTYHKILAGMIDMAALAGNKQALAVAEGMARWTGKWLEGVEEETMQKALRIEWGGMNEALYNLEAITKKTEYGLWADRFYKKPFMDPLVNHRDELTGLHANTHVPQVIGMARRYELTSYFRDRDISEFFWDIVVRGRTYATGGTSNSEGWRLEPARLSSELTVACEECCVSYNMMKLTRQLYTWTADPRYADFYERNIYNMRLGTQHPSDGGLMYYLPLISGFWKTFGTKYGAFWCCTGTGVEEFSKLGDSIYFHDDAGLYVNLFIASEVNWSEKGVKIRQETRFPEQEVTMFTIETSRPASFALNLRIPYWVSRGAAVKINGRALEASSAPSSYLTLQRTWKNGDRVELSLPMSLHAAPMPDDPTRMAIMYGPMVLAGLLGKVAAPDRIFGPSAPGRRDRKPTSVPAFQTAAKNPSEWIKPVPGQPLTFRTTGQSQDVTLVPLHRIFDEYYAVYLEVKPKSA